MLKVSDLRLKYPSGQRKIFDHLNITIQDKEKVLLLGPSGCGKSTLLNVLSGIVPNLIDMKRNGHLTEQLVLLNVTMRS